MGLLSSPIASAYTFSFKIPVGQPNFISPLGVAVASSDNIIVADIDNNRIQIFAP
ncbi:MAG: hypothetical protein GWM89_00105 [Candidatus Dadabacteria bacterium]|nr:hypothetical protein [Candidatus Dadabacteria bacterium]NIY20845.1 hypothetical protein [Candidatus Dadabacteria bacterium]